MLDYTMLKVDLVFAPIGSVFLTTIGVATSITLALLFAKQDANIPTSVGAVYIAIMFITLSLLFEVFQGFVPRTYELTTAAGKSVTVSNMAVFMGSAFDFLFLYTKQILNEFLHPKDDPLFQR